ncbi:hypothetical protein [Streptomyces violaceus]|uniref:HD domain-containing protein n=1 Tax=Streptomyces violaceus TaxID=1936 RepID=A0ABY9UKV0_STRVL|nr:hypothetical protein [Streptomyces janthinus]WND23508.1 hypothetical protein RI060_42035 [Streptomyces janthinus]
MRKRWVLRHRTKESVTRIAGELAWSVGAGLDQIVPTEHLGRTVRAAVLHDFAETVEMFADDENRRDGAASPAWWHLTLTPSVAKTLDWYIRCFSGEECATIGEIQREARKTWGVSAADTLSALRSALDLDGELTKKQRETYFALLEPHEDTD